MFKEQSGEKCTIYMCQAGGGDSGSLGEYSRCLKAAVVILKHTVRVGLQKRIHNEQFNNGHFLPLKRAV